MAFFSKKQSEGEPQNVDEILVEFKKVKDKCQKLAAKVDRLEEKNRQNIGKVGIVRFNPFEGFGGNQSFSLAMLNENDCGVAITSLFSRDGNRVYAKPIKNGESQYALSKEEKEAIALAQNSLNLKNQNEKWQCKIKNHQIKILQGILPQFYILNFTFSIIFNGWQIR